MSTTIDNKVVEMRFDNKQFEAATAQSMSTIDKLKHKLNFGSSAKSLEGLNKAANNVNMNSLSSAIDTVHTKFSALQVMGVTALANITNSAVNAGKRMVEALTIAPIRTGFQEYETQINSVQTILANTQHAGTTIKDVTKALDELNVYADKTIYNFTEMTRNIGTFTAAGIDLDTSVNAIQGIANLAAISGSTSQQASTAMYQLSQALAAGTVKLMDWNSVVNAGMGGKVFQDALMETARVHGVAIDSMIDEHGSFRETLQEGWITSEVLTETLEKFTMTTEGLTEEQIKANREMWKARGYTEEQIDAIFKLGETSTNAATKVKTFTQLWDVLKESAQSGWAKTWQLIFGDFEQAKTLWTPVAEIFTGLINKMSDARNKLLESALGMGFDKLQKTVSKALGPVEKVIDGTKKVTGGIDKVSDSLKDLDSIVDEVILGKFGDGQERFDGLTEAGYNFYKVQNKVNETLGNSHRYTEEQIEAQEKLLSGQEKTAEQTEKTEESTKKLTKAQKNQLKKIAAMTEEQAKANGCTEEQIKALRELNEVAEKLGMPLDELIDNLDEINGRWLLLNSFKNIGESLSKIFGALGDAMKDVFGTLKPESLFDAIAAWHRLTEQMVISDATAEKLKDAFRGVFSIIDILSIILGGGLRIAFALISSVLGAFGMTALDAASKLGNLIYKFNEWLGEHDYIKQAIEWLADKIPPLVDKVKEFIQELYVDSGAAENFQKIADGIQSIWNVLHSKVSLSLNSVLKIIGSIFKLFGTNLGEVLAKLADFVSKIVTWIAENTMLVGTIDKIAEALSILIEGIVTCAKAFMTLEPVQKLIENVKKAFEKLREVLKFDFDFEGFDGSLERISEIFEKIEGWIKNLDTSEAFQAGLNVVEGIANGISSGVGNVISAISNIAQNIINAFCRILGIHSPSTVMIALGGFIVSGLIIGILRMIPSAWSAITSFAEKIGSAFQNGFNGVIEFFGKIGDKIQTVIEGMGGIDWSALFVAGTIVAVLILLKKLLDIMDKIASPIQKIGDSIAGFFGKIGTSIEKHFKAKTLETKSKAILNIAKAIALLAASFYLLSRLDWASIGKGTVALVVISGALLLLTFAASKMDSVEFGKLALFMLGFATSVLILSKAMQMLSTIYVEDALSAIASLTLMIAGMGTLLYLFGKLITDDRVAANMSKAGTMFIKMAAAMIIMAYAIKVIAAIPGGDIIKGMAVITGLGLLFGAFVALSSISKHAKGAGSMMLKMAIALALIPIIIRLIAGIPNSDIVKGLLVIAGVELLFGAMIAVSYFAGAHASKAGSMLLKMSVAIGILAMTMKLFATMSYEDIVKGLLVIAGVEALFAAFIMVSKLAKNDGNKAGSMIFKMAAGMALMGLAIKLIATTSTGDIIKGLAVIAAIEVLFGAMVLLSNFGGAYADKAGSMMLKMSAAILILVAAVALLSLLDPKDVAIGTAAISAMMLSFAAIAYATSKMGNCMKQLIVIAVTLGVLVGAIIGLTFIDKDKVITAAAALSSVIGMLALLVGVSKFAGKVDKSLFLLIGVVAALGGILYLLADLPVESTISTAASLSVLLLAMATSLKIMSKIAYVSKSALLGMGVLTLIVAALAGILGLMDHLGVEGSIQTALSLSILLLAMSAALKIMSTVLYVSKSALLAMSILTIVVAMLAGILGLMDKFDVAPSIETATSLSILLIAMAAVTAILAAIGPIASGAIAGAGAFVAVVGILGALMIALGALVKYIPSMEEFLDRGIVVLEKIGYGLGSFFGNIIGGFADGALAGLPNIGKQLSDFMTNAKPFIDGAKTVDESVMKGATTLTRTILALTAANMLENIASFLQFGSSFSSLGTELSAFVNNAKPFIDAVKGFTPEMFEGVNSLTNAILTLTAASFIEGITRFMPISSSLSKFGSELPALGTSLKGFVTNLGTFTEEQVTTVKCAGNAIKALAEAGSTINGQAEWAKRLFGDNSLSTFAADLPATATALKGFVNNLGTFTEDQVTTVKCAGDAIIALAEAGNNLNGQSEWAKALFGDNSLSAFAADLPITATALKGFVNNLGTFTEDQVNSAKCAANTIKALAQAGSGIDGQSEWAKKLFGDNGLGTFSSQLPEVATNLKSFVTNLGTFGEDSIASVNSAVGVVKAMAKLGETDISTLTTTLPGFGDQLVIFADDLASFCEKIEGLDGSGVEDITSSIMSAIDSITAGISKKTGDMKSAGSKLTTALANGISSKKTAVNNAAKTAIGGASKAVTSKKDEFKKAGGTLGKAMADGIKDKKDSFKTAAESLCRKANNAIKEWKDTFKTAGKDLGQGLINGINAKKTEAYNAGFALGRKAAQGVKDGSDEESPSKLTYQYGIWQGEGLVNGIVAMGKKAYNAGYNLGDTAAKSMSDAIAKVSDILNSDMETQPTIRPVLDLSDVEAGAGSINGMFGINPSVGVLANVGAISSMMNRRNQNGGTGEIVSAIKKLGKDLGKTGNTYNSINGINVHDDNAVTEAIETIIRAATIERRI